MFLSKRESARQGAFVYRAGAQLKSEAFSGFAILWYHKTGLLSSDDRLDSDALAEQAMVIAVPVQHAEAADEKARLRIALGVKFDEVETVARDACEKGNIMSLGHRMVDDDIVLMFDDFALYGMGFVRFLGLQRRQCQPAAGNHSRTGAVQHVATDRADVQVRAQQIGSTIGVNDLFTAEQFGQRDLQYVRQWFE